MRALERVLHDVEKETPHTADWSQHLGRGVKIAKAEWALDREDDHGVRIADSSFTTKKATVKLEGGRPRCQYELTHSIVDSAGDDHGPIRYWVDTMRSD